MFLLKMESHLLFSSTVNNQMGETRILYVVFTQFLCLFYFRYFRHATGSLVILSKNLAQYININRLDFHNNIAQFIYQYKHTRFIIIAVFSIGV